LWPRCLTRCGRCGRGRPVSAEHPHHLQRCTRWSLVDIRGQRDVQGLPGAAADRPGSVSCLSVAASGCGRQWRLTTFDAGCIVLCGGTAGLQSCGAAFAWRLCCGQRVVDGLLGGCEVAARRRVSSSTSRLPGARGRRGSGRLAVRRSGCLCGRGVVRLCVARQCGPDPRGSRPSGSVTSCTFALSRQWLRPRALRISSAALDQGSCRKASLFISRVSHTRTRTTRCLPQQALLPPGEL
jgi:hypothetical protein